MWFSCFCSKLIQNYSNYLKYFIEVCVDSRFSSIMIEKCLFSLEKCSFLLENFFKTYARDRLVIARYFLMLKMLDHFSLEIAQIENSKSKIVLEIARIEKFNARNARDRCFCRSVSTLVRCQNGA